LRAFFGTIFKIKAVVPPAAVEGEQQEEGSRAPATEEYVLSCVGTGFSNTAKRMYVFPSLLASPYFADVGLVQWLTGECGGEWAERSVVQVEVE
jgi:hypothetical protein